MKNHAKSAISMAIQRMNGKPVAIRENDTSFLANIQQMLSCEDDYEDQEQLEADRNKTLCAAYGLGDARTDKPFAFSNGLAIIPIHGTLINRYGGYYHGWITGYNFIRSQRNAALADPDVTAIIYDVNSNGGEAAGCFELAGEMFDTRGVKPSLAVVDSNCYSAAYALASSADKISVTPSGGAGSIGVISMHIDMSKMLEDIGIKVSIIKSGDHKADGNPFEPLDESAKKEWQGRVDALRTDFVELVATNRGLDPKVVRDTEAMCYNAKDAQAIGLIDSVATPTLAVQDLLDGPDEGAEEQPGEQAMSFTQEQMDAAQKEAATAERTRISSILGCDAAKNRTKLASHIAYNTSMSVEEATGFLEASAEEATAPVVAPKAEAPTKTEQSPFGTVMNNADHPDIQPDAEAPSNEAESDGLDAAMAFVTGSATQA